VIKAEVTIKYGFSHPPDLHFCKVDRYRKECASIKKTCAFVM